MRCVNGDIRVYISEEDIKKLLFLDSEQFELIGSVCVTEEAQII
jgi:hypothetical protein